MNTNGTVQSNFPKLTSGDITRGAIDLERPPPAALAAAAAPSNNTALYVGGAVVVALGFFFLRGKK